MDDEIATEEETLNALEVEPADLRELPEDTDLPEDEPVEDEEDGA